MFLGTRQACSLNSSAEDGALQSGKMYSKVHRGFGLWKTTAHSKPTFSPAAAAAVVVGHVDYTKPEQQV